MVGEYKAQVQVHHGVLIHYRDMDWVSGFQKLGKSKPAKGR